MENSDQYYRSYKYMQKHLGTDFTANYLTSNMADNDKGEDILSGKLHEKVIDMEWVTAIEDTLPYIEKAIDEQRRFIIENNEVYRIDKAKIINKDSVKHLIQHILFLCRNQYLQLLRSLLHRTLRHKHQLHLRQQSRS